MRSLYLRGCLARHSPWEDNFASQIVSLVHLAIWQSHPVKNANLYLHRFCMISNVTRVAWGFLKGRHRRVTGNHGFLLVTGILSNIFVVTIGIEIEAPEELF